MFKLISVLVCLVVVRVHSKTSFKSLPCTETLPYADPHDCSKFWVCAPYGPQQMSCALGTWFNPAIHVCDWPSNVQCNAKPPNESEESNSSDESSEEIATPEITKPALKPTKPPLPGTSPEPEPETAVSETPEPESESVELDAESPEPETESPEPESPEPETESPEPETESTEPETESPEPDTESPEPESSEEETEIAEEESEALQPSTDVPAPSKPNDPPQRPKPEPEPVPDSPQTICQRHPDRLFLTAHPNYCTKFITCHHGVAVTFDCPDNTYYVQQLTACINDPSVCSRSRDILAY